MLTSIKQYFPALLAVVLLFTVTRCKDFEDCRTPYKSTITVKFTTPVSEKAKLAIDAIRGLESNQEFKGSKNEEATYVLPLDPHADSVVFVIGHFPFTDTLTIHYERVVSLLSPQCGAQQEYVLKKVESTFTPQPKIFNHNLSIFNGSGPDVEVYF